MIHGSILPTWILGLALVLGFNTSSCYAADEVPETTAAPVGGDFSMASANGPLNLSDLEGKLVMLFFGYSKCPDVCPISLATLAQAFDGLEETELKQTAGLFISVDYKRDNPQDLQLYASYFHDNFIGATGTEAQIETATRLYGAKYYEVALEGSAFGYSVNHSAATYLITPAGELRFVFPHNTPSSVLRDAMQHVLAGN